jgi:chaperone modulatory protein CbpM
MNEFHVRLTVQEVCLGAGLSTQQLLDIVACGILEPEGDVPELWRFDADTLSRAKRACRLHYDLEMEWSAIALVLDLLQDKEDLRRENHLLRQQLQRFLED